MRNFTKSISQEYCNISCIPHNVASWITCRLRGNIDVQQYYVRILFLPLSSPFFLFVCTKSCQYWQYLRKNETSLSGRLIKLAHPRSEAARHEFDVSADAAKTGSYCKVRFSWRREHRVGTPWYSAGLEYWFSDDDWVVTSIIFWYGQRQLNGIVN